MSSRITFIDNNIDSGDWFVKFFELYQGVAETVEHIGMTDEEILNWREVLYGEK